MNYIFKLNQTQPKYLMVNLCISEVVKYFILFFTNRTQSSRRLNGICTCSGELETFSSEGGGGYNLPVFPFNLLCSQMEEGMSMTNEALKKPKAHYALSIDSRWLPGPFLCQRPSGLCASKHFSWLVLYLRSGHLPPLSPISFFPSSVFCCLLKWISLGLSVLLKALKKLCISDKSLSR